MERKIQAVYSSGVLRPMEPLQLDEMQQVTLTITESSAVDGDLAGYFPAEKWAEAAQDRITWDDARKALSGTSGSLSDLVVAQRQER
jgi:predicted DNA-binding antitoxin AbrB/MazE fold protein